MAGQCKEVGVDSKQKVTKEATAIYFSKVSVEAASDGDPFGFFLAETESNVWYSKPGLDLYGACAGISSGGAEGGSSLNTLDCSGEVTVLYGWYQ